MSVDLTLAPGALEDDNPTAGRLGRCHAEILQLRLRQTRRQTMRKG